MNPFGRRAIADAVKLARQNRRRPIKMGEMGMFSGMMFCVDCGSVMYQCRATGFRKDQEYYLRAGYRKSRDVCGSTHSIRTVILEELLLINIREIVSLVSKSKEQFVRMVMDTDMKQRNKEIAQKKKLVGDMEKRIAELDVIFKRLYEDNIFGKLSDERFRKLSFEYETEQSGLQNQMVLLRKDVEAAEGQSANVDKFLAIVNRYTETPELTPRILHEFVEKIVVHAATDPHSKVKRTQKIYIYTRALELLECKRFMQQDRNKKNGIAVQLYRFSFPSQCFLMGNAHYGCLFFVGERSCVSQNTIKVRWNSNHKASFDKHSG